MCSEIFTIIKVERVPRLKEACCHLDSTWKPDRNVGVKNSQKSKIIDILLYIPLIFVIQKHRGNNVINTRVWVDN